MGPTPSSANPVLRFSQVLQEELQALRPGDAGVDGLGAKADATADPAARLKTVLGAAHGLEHGLSGLCLSGGGIRSATFNLGALQGLARLGVLKQFDYLSSVSGGGYIASWLSSWIQRTQSPQAVEESLAHVARDALAPEPEPIAHLRRYSNYRHPLAWACCPPTPGPSSRSSSATCSSTG